MLTLHSLLKVKLCTAYDKLFLELEIFIQNTAQREDLRLTLIIYKGQHVDREIGLHCGLSKEAVEHNLGICIALKLNYHTHTVAVGLITQVGNTLKTLFAYLIGNILYKLTLIDLIRKLRNYDTVAALELFKLGTGADDNLAAAGSICLTDTAAAHDNTLGGEIGTLNILHQVAKISFGIVKNADAGINNFLQIVRRNIGSHTNSYT